MKFKFEKLIIWQKDFGELSRTAIEYGENVNKLSYKFPKEEMYNLSFQIRRIVNSIAFNLMNMMIAFKGKIN